jgi:hypothetical protein
MDIQNIIVNDFVNKIWANEPVYYIVDKSIVKNIHIGFLPFFIIIVMIFIMMFMNKEVKHE